jgi:hypothetical protein
MPPSPASVPAPADAAALLQALAVPLLQLDGTGHIRWANEAATALTPPGIGHGGHGGQRAVGTPG